jgi:hypothetical protein
MQLREIIFSKNRHLFVKNELPAAHGPRLFLQNTSATGFVKGHWTCAHPPGHLACFKAHYF